MIVYASSKKEFCNDVRLNRIDTEIVENFKARLGYGPCEAEVSAFRNSMPFMYQIVAHELPDDTGIAIEYKIPQTSRRVDFILTGLDENDRPAAVVVELKQWTQVGITEKDAVVETILNGGWREVSHPSYQAWSYTQLMRDFNEAVEKNGISLYPCAYLHNCTEYDVVLHQNYASHIELAPVFLKSDTAQLTSFIKKYVRKGDKCKLIYEIENGRIRPSKSLTDHLSSLLAGNQEFLMIDDQKVVYETALCMADKASPNKKQVLIVEGGPGTGKSVVAINLLVELTKRKHVAQYISKNSAPREVYSSRLSKTMRKNRISSLFRGSACFAKSRSGDFNALIVDEHID